MIQPRLCSQSSGRKNTRLITFLLPSTCNLSTPGKSCFEEPTGRHFGAGPEILQKQKFLKPVQNLKSFQSGGECESDGEYALLHLWSALQHQQFKQQHEQPAPAAELPNRNSQEVSSKAGAEGEDNEWRRGCRPGRGEERRGDPPRR